MPLVYKVRYSLTLYHGGFVRDHAIGEDVIKRHGSRAFTLTTNLPFVPPVGMDVIFEDVHVETRIEVVTWNHIQKQFEVALGAVMIGNTVFDATCADMERWYWK